MEIIKLPMIGLSEESAIITNYYVKVGDSVAVGDNLFAIENGKATYDVPAEVEGFVLAILQEEGEEYAIETPMLVIGAEGEQYLPEAAEAPAAALADEPAESPEAAVRTETAEQPSAAAASLKPEKTDRDGHAALSPRARKRADGHSIDFDRLTPTGPNGMIIERDIQAWLDQAPAVRDRQAAGSQAVQPAAEEPGRTAQGITYTDQKMSGIRRVIADNMLASTTGLAQSTMTTSFDATQILNLRKQFKSSSDPEVAAVGIGDMIYYAIVKTVLSYPFFNAHFLGDRYIVREFDHVHLGVAVDTPKGLMVPTVFHADQMSLRELAKEIKRLATACREGTVNPAELQGASLTVSNMGVAGAETFTPIINPPQTAIVGVCRVQYRARPKADGEFEFYPALPLALTIDHRVSDGTPSGLFMTDVCRKLENFTELLV